MTTATTTVADLSPTEAWVLRLLAEGKDDKKIAERTGYSVSYTRQLVSGLYDRLGLPAEGNQRVLAARWWWEREAR